MRGLLRERLVQVVQRHAVVVADRRDEVAADVDVDLDRRRRHLRRVEDEQELVLVRVGLRPLPELQRVLERDGVQPERVAELLDLVRDGRTRFIQKKCCSPRSRSISGSSTAVSTCMAR